MLKSMTGYGRGAYDDKDFSFAIEIKTVNHRYNEVAIRLPRFLNPLEDKIRKAILNRINRGRVDVFIVASYTAGENCQVKVDKNLAMAYNNALQDIATASGIKAAQLNEGAKLLYLAKCPEVISAKEGFFDVDALWPHVEAAMNEALDHLIAMRETEGKNISGDIAKRAQLISEKLAAIEERAPLVVTDYQAKLNERIEELLKGSGQIVDQERVIQEVAIFADRVNITEEIVRLKSHLKQFGEMLESPKPIGRKMDFLVQEFNREANTIASKSNDLTITRLTVEIKGEIEKIREQIQNIE
jgi:uncharacterized protein (TIGR00255 family)